MPDGAPKAELDNPTLGILAVPPDASAGEPTAEESCYTVLGRVSPVHVILVTLGTIAFLYFARPVMLPLLLAWMAATALRPAVRWLSCLHISTPVSAGIVFCVLVGVISFGFVQLERPAANWLNQAPEHMSVLRHRFMRLFPKATHLSEATEAVTDLGATDAEKRAKEQIPVVEVKDQRGTSSILNWTGTFLAGLGEVLVLIYLLLAAGDMFLQKLVRLMPTLSGKKQAVEITHEIQLSISNYLFTISIINTALGILLSIGLSLMGVPNAAMWGVLAAFVNFVPYFGPICGVVLLAAVGLLTFNSPAQGILPPLWYMALHMVESNLVTPILLGRRFWMNPVAIFVSLLFWLWLWGIPGALLSVPILVSIKVVCDRVPAISYIGELIGR